MYILENILPSLGENIAVVFWVEKYEKRGERKRGKCETKRRNDKAKREIEGKRARLMQKDKKKSGRLLEGKILSYRGKGEKYHLRKGSGEKYGFRTNIQTPVGKGYIPSKGITLDRNFLYTKQLLCRIPIWKMIIIT